MRISMKLTSYDSNRRTGFHSWGATISSIFPSTSQTLFEERIKHLESKLNSNQNHVRLSKISKKIYYWEVW